MRELMFASGGRCAMTDCGLSLTSPTGGWIGTVAHIVGAEVDGPRGVSPLTPTQRAAFDNLILMCATHGREVDAPETGEANYPVDKLRLIKQAHEAKVSEAVAAAIEQEVSGVQSGIGSVDTSLRSSTAAVTADGLAESLGVDGAPESEQIVAGLAEARARLRRLSQPALDTLSQLLALWVYQCSDEAAGTFDFSDWHGTNPQLPCQIFDNRVMRGKQGLVDQAMEELKAQEVVSVDYDEYAGVAYYTLGSLSMLGGLPYNFWRSTAQFLYDGHGVQIQDWILGLDFSIFDRFPPAGRDVPWR